MHARRLEQLEGVASVAVVGAPKDEIRVDVDPDRMRALGLSPDDVAQAIQAANASAPGGTIRRGQFRFSVRALTEFRTLDEIGDTPVGPGRRGIRLADIATVTLATADPRTVVQLDGKPAVGLVVYKDAGANTVAVTRKIYEAVGQLEREFPDIQLTVVAAQARFVKDALSNLGQEIVLGGLLSLLVIMLFLQDWRASLAIGLIVPLSVLVALVMLQLLHVSINVLSLGGLALGVGLLVDNAIVVAEATRRNGTKGMPAGGSGAGRQRGSGRAADRRHAHHAAGVRTDHLRAGPGRGTVPRPVPERRDVAGGVTDAGADADAGDDGADRRTGGRDGQVDEEPTARPPGRPTAAHPVGCAPAELYEHGMAWSLDHPRRVFAVSLALVLATGCSPCGCRGKSCRRWTRASWSPR